MRDAMAVPIRPPHAGNVGRRLRPPYIAREFATPGDRREHPIERVRIMIAFFTQTSGQCKSGEFSPEKIGRMRCDMYILRPLIVQRVETEAA